MNWRGKNLELKTRRKAEWLREKKNVGLEGEMIFYVELGATQKEKK